MYHFLAVCCTLGVLVMLIATSKSLVEMICWLALVGWMWWWQWQLWRGRRGWQARISGESYGIRPGPGRIKLHRWKGDEEVDFRRRSDGMYDFTIRDKLSVPVKLEISCHDAEAEALRSRIQAILNRHVGLEK
jgi:hypothetical protein